MGAKDTLPEGLKLGVRQPAISLGEDAECSKSVPKVQLIELKWVLL